MRKLNKKPRKKNMSTHQMCSSCAECSWASCLRGGPPSPSTPSSRLPTYRHGLVRLQQQLLRDEEEERRDAEANERDVHVWKVARAGNLDETRSEVCD